MTNSAWAWINALSTIFVLKSYCCTYEYFLMTHTQQMRVHTYTNSWKSSQVLTIPENDSFESQKMWLHWLVGCWIPASDRWHMAWSFQEGHINQSVHIYSEGYNHYRLHLHLLQDDTQDAGLQFYFDSLPSRCPFSLQYTHPESHCSPIR